MAHVHRPLILVDVQPIEVDMLHDPAGKLVRPDPRYEEINRRTASRADECPTTPKLAGGMLINLRSDASHPPSNEPGQLRASESIAQARAAPMGADGFQHMLGKRRQRLPRRRLARRVEDLQVFAEPPIDKTARGPCPGVAGLNEVGESERA